MLVFNDHSTSQPQMACVALPRRGLEDVTGIVSATMLRNTVRDSRMVTPDQGLWLVLEFDSIQDNFPSSTATLSRLQILSIFHFSLATQIIICNVISWDALVTWEHGLINTILCWEKIYRKVLTEQNVFWRSVLTTIEHFDPKFEQNIFLLFKCHFVRQKFKSKYKKNKNTIEERI